MDSKKICIVIVLYQKRPDESESLRTIERVIACLRESGIEHSLIIYENAAPAEAYLVSGNTVQIRSKHNGGVCKPYNTAYRYAQDSGYQWLLLLDQDTVLTEAYGMALADAITKEQINAAAYVPRIISHGTQISPVTAKCNVFRGSSHNSTKYLTAINSGALINVDFLTDIGGFDTRFWLDYLDHWLFWIIAQKGYTTTVMNVALEHDLSVHTLSKVSPERYDNILQAEGLFYHLTQGKRAPLKRSLLLAARCVKLGLIARDYKKLSIACRHLVTTVNQAIN